MRNTIWYPLFNGALLLGFMLILSGCLPGWNSNPVATGEEINEIVEVEALQPPLWIQGTWVSGTDEGYEVVFTANGAAVLALGSRTDYGVLFENTDPEIANQQSSEAMFAFVVQPEAESPGVTVMFNRIDDNTVQHTIQLNPEMSVGPIPLYRKGTEPAAEPAPPPVDDPPPPPTDPPPADEPPADPPEPPQNEPEQIGSVLNPPLWIQGDWGTVVEGEYDVEFRTDTMIVTALDFPIDYGQLYRDADAIVEETISEDLYTFEVTSDDGSLDETFIFVRLNDQSIMHSIEKVGGVTIGPVTLFRPDFELPPIEAPPADDPPPTNPPPANPPVEEPAAACEDWQVDINSASKEALTRIIHVGDGLITADAIIAARPFTSVDDLLNVTGISEAHLSDITEQNVACVN